MDELLLYIVITGIARGSNVFHLASPFLKLEIVRAKVHVIWQIAAPWLGQGVGRGQREGLGVQGG